MARSYSNRRRPALTRPQKWVIALALLALGLGLANLVRGGVALRYASLLPELPTTVPLAVVAATGAFWGVAWITCAVGLARFRPWGQRGTLATASLYEINVWINHLLFDASDYARQARPWDLLLTALLLSLVWGSLSLHSVREVFVPSRINSQEAENNR